MAKDRQGNVVGPWRDEFDAMAKKTCVRQLAKFMPKGTDLATALAVDDTVRVDLDPRTSPEYVAQHVERSAPPETVHVGEVIDDATDPWPAEGGEQA